MLIVANKCIRILCEISPAFRFYRFSAATPSGTQLYSSPNGRKSGAKRRIRITREIKFVRMCIMNSMALSRVLYAVEQWYGIWNSTTPSQTNVMQLNTRRFLSHTILIV